jgi:hypothetical protein
MKPMTDITAGNGHDTTGGPHPPSLKARASKDALQRHAPNGTVTLAG